MRHKEDCSYMAWLSQVPLHRLSMRVLAHRGRSSRCDTSAVPTVIRTHYCQPIDISESPCFKHSPSTIRAKINEPATTKSRSSLQASSMLQPGSQTSQSTASACARTWALKRSSPDVIMRNHKPTQADLGSGLIARSPPCALGTPQVLW